MAKFLFIQKADRFYGAALLIHATIKDSHEMKIAVDAHENVVKKYLSFKPDVVGITCFSMEHTWALDIARKIKVKNKNALIMLGGVHPTFYTDVLNNKNIDIICRGRGEKSVLELLNKIDNKESYEEIKSLWIKKNDRIIKNDFYHISKDDSIPLFDYSIYDNLPNKGGDIEVIGQLGCHFNCKYCSNYGYNKIYKYNNCNFKKEENLIKELKYLVKKRKSKKLYFGDDIFGYNKQWLDNFLELYMSEINLPFGCHSKFGFITEEFVDKVKKAGCATIGFGVESGNKKIRESLNRYMSNDRMIKDVKMVKKRGIKIALFNMVGLPGETFKEALETLDLNIKLNPACCICIPFQPYPGTFYYNESVKKDIISPKFSRFKINHFYSKDSKRLQRLSHLFTFCVRYPSIRSSIPFLTSLPLDKLYDYISAQVWARVYKKNNC